MEFSAKKFIRDTMTVVRGAKDPAKPNNFSNLYRITKNLACGNRLMFHP